jgi:hypothetical protein
MYRSLFELLYAKENTQILLFKALETWIWFINILDLIELNEIPGSRNPTRPGKGKKFGFEE